MNPLFSRLSFIVRSHPKASLTLGSILVLGYTLGGLAFYQAQETERCHDGSVQERRVCYRDYYRTLTEERGAQVALADIAQKQAEGDLWNQCHELVHVIGETAGKSGKPLSDIFAEGSAFCRAGYYHGVLAEIVKRQGDVPSSETLTALCAELPGKGTGTGLYRHCTHGVGHGLMFATHGDVLGSLAKCGAFPSVLDQKECAGGVYMEHFMADGMEHVSKEATTSIEELCKKSPSPYADVCYERAGTEFASDNYQNPQKSFLLCLALPVPLAQKERCIAGIGLISIGEEDLRPSDPSLYCAHGESVADRKICYQGAITTMGKVAPELGDPQTVICGRVEDLVNKAECLGS